MPNFASSGAIKLGNTAFGKFFLENKLNEVDGAVSNDYLHLSLSVVTGGYNPNQALKDGQISEYERIVSEAMLKISALKNPVIETGNLKVNKFNNVKTIPLQQVRVELEVKCDEINKIVAEMEKDIIDKTGLTLAKKSGSLHMTVASKETAVNALTVLSNQTFSLGGAVVSMVTYPKALLTGPDFTKVDLLTGHPSYVVAATPAVATPAPPVASTPAFKQGKVEITGIGVLASVSSGKPNEIKGEYYPIVYSSGSTVRAYLSGHITNGDGTTQLDSSKSPLLLNDQAILKSVFAHFNVVPQASTSLAQKLGVASTSPQVANTSHQLALKEHLHQLKMDVNMKEYDQIKEILTQVITHDCKNLSPGVWAQVPDASDLEYGIGGKTGYHALCDDHYEISLDSVSGDLRIRDKKDNFKLVTGVENRASILKDVFGKMTSHIEAVMKEVNKSSFKP